MLIDFNDIPYDPAVDKKLPGIAPCAPHEWLWVGADYRAQMRRRIELLQTKTNEVLEQPRDLLHVCAELLEHVITFLHKHEVFTIQGGTVHCPDGRRVSVDAQNPLGTLGALVQEDFCILQAGGDKAENEYLLKAALLCFPASWCLEEKINRPMMRIHAPAPEYNPDVAKRVARLFNGLQVGRPLWRYNLHFYDDEDLFTPRREAAPRGPCRSVAPYWRTERQTLYRLPQSQAVVFGIRTFISKPPNRHT